MVYEVKVNGLASIVTAHAVSRTPNGFLEFTDESGKAVAWFNAWDSCVIVEEKKDA